MRARLLAALLWLSPAAGATALIDEQIAAHPGQSGAYVLETGEEPRPIL